jgi:hydroxymethylpyrimidine pyrophosphatase-like HAD family hydrolase
MTTRRFEAVITDIDGCLGPESAAPLDAPLLAQIADYNTRAKRDRSVASITVCSGRPLPYAEAICRLIGNDTLPAVCEMGVWLLDLAHHEYIMDPAISTEQLEAVRAAQSWIERNLLSRGVLIQPGKTASISLWHRDTSYLMSLKPELFEKFQTHAWPLRISNTVAWINCDLAHVSKSSGIARFKQRTGLQRSQLAGIGDTLGDLAIREHVAFFGVPANAQDELKAQADYISPFHETRGVLDILQHIETLSG